MSITMSDVDFEHLYQELSKIRPSGLSFTPLQRIQRMNCLEEHVGESECTTCNVKASLDGIDEEVQSGDQSSVFKVYVKCPSCQIRAGCGIFVNN